MRGSRASESTSGVERDPGEVQASRRPQRRELVDEGAQAEVGVGAVWHRPGLVPADDLVLLHGFTQTSASWDGVLRELAGRYRAYAPDLGEGPWGSELDRLEALAPPRFTLCGYSMGGRLALALALRIPDRVERLVLISASPGLANDGERAARRSADGALADRIEAIGVEAFARAWATQPLFAGQAAEVRTAAHADRLRRSAGSHAAQLRGLGTGVMPPLWERLRELPMPVTPSSANATRSSAPSPRRWASRPWSCRARGTPSRWRRRPRLRRTWRCPEPLALPESGGSLARMLRTTRTYRRGKAALTWLGEWRLPPPERRAARAARDAERRMWLERDDTSHLASRRAAATEAERRRWAGWGE